MNGVLVIGRVRPERRGELEALLTEGPVGARMFRQGETLALLLDGPQAEGRFLALLSQRESRLARIVDCLENVPLVPPEVTATAA